jgi:hypothetical protein
MYYVSPYFGRATAKTIQRKSLKVVTGFPSPIDPAIQGLMVEVNSLPFVLHTIECCSGHVNCPTGLPEEAEDAITYYWNSLHSRFGHTGGQNKKNYLKFLHPKFQLVAYFLIPEFYEEVSAGGSMPFDELFQLPRKLQKSFDKLYDGSRNYVDYSSIVTDPRKTKLFQDIADHIWRNDKNHEVYTLLKQLADRIITTENVDYCGWAWGSPDTQAFLQILYIKCPEALAFHKELAKLFRGHGEDRVMLNYSHDIDLLEDIISGDPDATCIACFYPVSDPDCNHCYQEYVDAEEELARLKDLSQIQFIGSYWKDFKRITIPNLEKFWRKVASLVRKYS